MKEASANHADLTPRQHDLLMLENVYQKVPEKFVLSASDVRDIKAGKRRLLVVGPPCYTATIVLDKNHEVFERTWAPNFSESVGYFHKEETGEAAVTGEANRWFKAATGLKGWLNEQDTPENAKELLEYRAYWQGWEEEQKQNLANNGRSIWQQIRDFFN
jgi:hypothetical protein